MARRRPVRRNPRGPSVPACLRGAGLRAGVHTGKHGGSPHADCDGGSPDEDGRHPGSSGAAQLVRRSRQLVPGGRRAPAGRGGRLGASDCDVAARAADLDIRGCSRAADADGDLQGPPECRDQAARPSSRAAGGRAAVPHQQGGEACRGLESCPAPRSGAPRRHRLVRARPAASGERPRHPPADVRRAAGVGEPGQRALAVRP